MKRKEPSLTPPPPPPSKAVRPGSEDGFNESLGVTSADLQELEDSALVTSTAAGPEDRQAGLLELEEAPAMENEQAPAMENVQEESQGNAEARGGAQKIKVLPNFSNLDMRERPPPSPGQEEKRKKALEASLLRQERQKRKEKEYAAWLSADIDAFMAARQMEEKKGKQDPKN